MNVISRRHLWIEMDPMLSNNPWFPHQSPRSTNWGTRLGGFRYVENETAWPNFGKDEFVTGLQPNVRAQSLVMIFKRKI